MQVTPASDGREGEVDRDLEEAWGLVRRAGLGLRDWDAVSVDPQPVALSLGTAGSRIFDAMDGRGDPLAALRDAGVALEEVRAWAGPRGEDAGAGRLLEQATLARVKLASAERRLARERPPAEAAVAPLRASGDEPRLHHIARRPLTWSVETPKAPRTELAVAPVAPKPPSSFEELHATIAAMRAPPEKRADAPARPADAPAAAPLPPRVPPPGFALDASPVAVTPIAFMEERAREMFEEVAMVALQRTPIAGEPWRDVLLLERRMLAATDAIAAIGPIAVEHVGRLWADAPLRDGHHAFALAACMGTIAGRDALAVIEGAVFAKDRSDDVARGIAAALRFAPHDRLLGALRSWLIETDPLVRALAVETLVARGVARPDELATAAADDDARVAAPALIALASAGTPHPELRGLVDRAVGSNSAAHALAGHIAATTALLPFAASALAERVRTSREPDAIRWLGIAGDEADAAWLLEQAIADPTPPLVEALGWAGSRAALSPLIGLLAHEDDEVVASAATALERITGADLLTEVEIADDLLEPAVPPDPPIAAAKPPRLARVVSDRRDLPPEPAAETTLAPSREAEAWAAWLAEHGGRLDSRSRLRRGSPHAPGVIWSELDGSRASPRERSDLQRELVLRTGRHVGFDPADLVAAQERALAAWAPVARSSSSAPGRWQLPSRRQ